MLPVTGNAVRHPWELTLDSDEFDSTQIYLILYLVNGRYPLGR